MTTYKIRNLSDGTSDHDRQRLQGALKAAPGVNVVTLSPSRSELSISFRGNQPLTNEALASILGAVGFELETRISPWVR
jgi:hypothetical protein